MTDCEGQSVESVFCMLYVVRLDETGYYLLPTNYISPHVTDWSKSLQNTGSKSPQNTGPKSLQNTGSKSLQNTGPKSLQNR